MRGLAVGEADVTATYQTITGQLHLSVLPGMVPGGLAAGQYRYPASNLDNAEFFFTIESDPGTTQGVFWAHQFFFENGSGDDGAYLGLQTRGQALGREVGKMAIYSVWGALDAVAGPGASAERFTHEGVGYSLRLPFGYRQGVTYRFRVSKESGGWWTVVLRDMSNGSEVALGRILGKSTWGGLSSFVANFTEVYLRVAGCAALEYARVRFDPPMTSGPTLQASVTNHHTYGPCASSARTAASNSTLVHEIGVR